MTHPNLLFILTDEQRRDTLACYGNEYVQMPCLNALAEQSCVFDDAHCADPVCTPSRGSILTGLHPHSHGATDLNIPLNEDARCLPELFPREARAPYRTEYHGKWHLGDEIYAQHGYASFLSVEDSYTDYFTEKRDKSDRSDYHHFLLNHGFTLGTHDCFTRHFAAQLPERYSKPKFQADQACRFIRHNRDRPWMLTVSMLEPHMPFYGCRDGQYSPDEIPMFSNFDHIPDEDPESQPLPEVIRERLRLYREKGYEGHDLRTERGWRNLTAKYLGLCSLIDTHVGRILLTLSECGLDQNTVVVFTSDHGDLMGSHCLLEKQLLYREATRVPMLIRLPGQTQSVRLTGPVSQVDLAPTLLELLGQPVPSGLHGQSLAPLLQDAVLSGKEEVSAADSASDCVISQEPMQTRTLIGKDNWRYSNYAGTGEFELYDLNSDPGERRNLAVHPAHAGRVRDMHERLTAWQYGTGDTIHLPSPAAPSL